MKDVEYAYAVAYIKTLENKLLSPSDIEGLIHAADAAAVMRQLRERGFVGDTADELLKNSMEQAWSVAYEVCPDEAPIDILLYENDFHNLKTILKAHIGGVDWQSMVIVPSIIAPQKIADAVRDNDYSTLPDFIRDTALEGYKLLTSTMDGQQLEIFVDKRQQLAVLARARAQKNEQLLGYAVLLCTLTNMKTAWRCMALKKSAEFMKNALTPDKDTAYDRLAESEDLAAVREVILSRYSDADISSLSTFERWCDNKRLSYVRSAKAQSFGFMPIVAFLIGKSFEIQALRVILSCKAHDVDEQTIRERLRDLI